MIYKTIQQNVWKSIDSKIYNTITRNRQLNLTMDLSEHYYLIINKASSHQRERQATMDIVIRQKWE